MGYASKDLGVRWMLLKNAGLDEYFDIDKFGDDAEFNAKFGHGGNNNPAAGHVSRGSSGNAGSSRDLL